MKVKSLIVNSFFIIIHPLSNGIIITTSMFLVDEVVL